MSLFDLQDVCIAIGSLAILDLPMVADLIGIYGLKGPFLSIPTFVFDDFGGAGFLVSCSVDCYSLEVVERIVEVSVKLLVYEDFWRNLIERSLIVVRFWIFSSSESLPYFPSQERSGCLGRELQRLVRTLLRCVVPEKSNAIIEVVTTGFECLPPSCDGLTGSEDHGTMISPVDTPCGYRGKLDDLPVDTLV
ncbi:hypothetical protein F511_40522 [Dorcoceras hygrometricum]|uniref:Uncharacterized protein n=1 Tax=Dorcoceras hygrometricum TaxID=472368 RepID=A0A2Z7ALG4_9LAMI|nr:hypothetical protein F511_40522 [Dorcoceras hygrometricum]